MKVEEKIYKELLSRVSVGDQQAFSTVYDIFSFSLTKYIVSKINDHNTAEDIVHDVFLSLWKNREKADQIENIEAYLYTSCRYLVIKNLNKTHNLVNLEDNFPNHDIATTEHSIEERLFYRYLIDIVEQEIENLPKKCKEVFILSRKALKSNREIAELLGISESTVENHINKAIKHLRINTKHLLTLYIIAKFL